MKAHVALCIFLVGCMADPPSLDESETVEALLGCHAFECGSNSPVIDAVEFYDLPETFNTLNDEGFKITKVSLNGNSDLKLDVVGDEIIIRNKAGGVFRRGYDVRFASITVVRGDRQYQLMIGNVDKTNYWAVPVTYYGNAPWTWAYKLQWRYPPYGEAFSYVCGVAPETQGLGDFWSVVYADEHINKGTLEVMAPRDNWFNIGCAGHTLAKQHLMGYTEASRGWMGWPATQAQKTANLKMLTADYCGIGHPFTVAGQPLIWRDKEWTAIPPNNPIYFRGPYNNTAKKTSVISMSKVLEARWSAEGATCLNTPRVTYRPTASTGQTDFPQGIAQAMADVCPPEKIPEPCTGTWQDQQGASVVSVNWKYNIIPL
jgi:hypothetical protein